MSDERAIFAAICAHPEEDTPRLAYADWLQENGDDDARAQAEFIRTQIERYRLPPESDNAEMVERRIWLENRERELQSLPNGGRRPWAYAHQKLAWLPEGVKLLWGHPEWLVRGFRGFAAGHPTALLAAGEALFDLFPVHGFFGCTNVSPLAVADAEPLFATRWLSRIRRAELSLESQCIGPLFRCEHLANLESLLVRFPVAGMPPATGNPGALARLRKLQLQFEGAASDGFSAIGHMARLLPENSLTELTFTRSEHQMGDLLTAVASHERFRNLTRLEAAMWSMRDGRMVLGLGPLTHAPFWPKLRTLALTMGFQNVDAFELAGAAPIPELRRLDLGWNDLTPVGLATLLDSPLLQSVTELRITRGVIGDEGARLLAKSPHLGNLAVLDVSDCRFGPRGVRAIVEAPWAEHLVSLSLQRNAIKKAGVEALTAPGRLPRLRRIGLFNTVRTQELQKRLTDRFGPACDFYP
jgi:uncharacterized protein (TIGR02996 family)